MLAINFGNPCTNGNYTMMTSPNGNIFRVTGPLCGEFTGPGEFPTQRPVTRSFDAFFDLRLNKRLSKQPWGWWFETPSWSLWRQCNAVGGQHFVYLLQLSLWFCSRLIYVQRRRVRDWQPTGYLCYQRVNHLTAITLYGHSAETDPFFNAIISIVPKLHSPRHLANGGSTSPKICPLNSNSIEYSLL